MSSTQHDNTVQIGAGSRRHVCWPHRNIGTMARTAVLLLLCLDDCHGFSHPTDFAAVQVMRSKQSQTMVGWKWIWRESAFKWTPSNRKAARMLGALPSAYTNLRYLFPETLFQQQLLLLPELSSSQRSLTAFASRLSETPRLCAKFNHSTCVMHADTDRKCIVALLPRSSQLLFKKQSAENAKHSGTESALCLCSGAGSCEKEQWEATQVAAHARVSLHGPYPTRPCCCHAPGTCMLFALPQADLAVCVPRHLLQPCHSPAMTGLAMHDLDHLQVNQLRLLQKQLPEPFHHINTLQHIVKCSVFCYWCCINHEQ